MTAARDLQRGSSDVCSRLKLTCCCCFQSVVKLFTRRPVWFYFQQTKLMGLCSVAGQSIFSGFLLPELAALSQKILVVVVAFIYSRLLNRHKKSTSRVSTGEGRGGNNFICMWRKRREGGSIKHFAAWRKSTAMNTKDYQGLNQGAGLSLENKEDILDSSTWKMERRKLVGCFLANCSKEGELC